MSKATVDISLVGAKELEAKLLSLERKVSKKIVRTGVRKAQKHLSNSVKTFLGIIRKKGRMTQKIDAALIVRAPKKQKKGSYALHVQLRDDAAFKPFARGGFFFSNLLSGEGGGKGKIGGTSYIPAAIEYGHGKNKKQSARPFMRPAADATVTSRINILNKELKIGIAKIWKSKKG